MKKLLHVLFVLSLLLQVAGTASATNATNNSMRTSQSESDIPHRKVYGFFLNSYDFGGQYGIGTIWTDNVQNTELIIPFDKEFSTDRMEGIYAGAAADGVYYGAVYEYQEMGPPLPGQFISIDLKTGKRTDIGTWSNSPDESERTALRLQDMTYSYADKTMYVLGFLMGSQQLYSIDLQTAEMTEIVKVPQTCSSIACNYEGQLYAMTNNGLLCKLNKQTGELTTILETGYGSPMSANSLEFDHTDGSLYWACNSYDFNSRLYPLFRFTFDESGNATIHNCGSIGQYPEGAAFYGLYIPFVLDGDETPQAPSDIQFAPDQTGKLEVTISWKNPTQTFGYKDLTELTSVTIMRNGQILTTIDTTQPGAAMEYKDTTVPDNGEWNYVIYASNSHGDGVKEYLKQYVGVDLPAMVKNLIATPGKECKTVHLQWDKVGTGAHGLFCDPETVTYRIVRLPDNKTIAEGLKNTEFVDETITRIAAYQYLVYSCNEIGDTKSASNGLVAGKALNTPYLETFADMKVVGNQWMGFDGNSDRYTWTFNSGAGYYTFRDYATAAEYFINPTFTPADIISDANEWIITPPILFEAGKEYTLSFDYRSISTENLTVTTGDTNLNSDQTTVVKDWELTAIPESSTDFITKEMKIEAAAQDVVRCFGFHLTTPFPTSRISYIQITNISVKEYGGSSIELNPENAISVIAANGEIRINGNFARACVYNLAGNCIVSTDQAVIPTANFAKGVYIIRVENGADIHTCKIIVD